MGKSDIGDFQAMRGLLICSLAILLANCIQAADVFKNEKVKLGKRTCTCTFTMETKGNKCTGQAKCDKKCTGNGAVEVGDYSFTLAVKKGKGKIAKCTVAVMPTVGPVEPTGSGSGPVEPTGSGSGSGPVEPTGSGSGPPPPTGSGSGEVPVPMGEGMPCSCRCNCPDGAEQCDCDCNCPMMSTSVSCASGFTRVCPMMSDVCPTDTMMMCPNGGMPPAAGRMMHGSSGSSGCQCVPDFLMALVHHAMPAATRMEATDRAKDVFKNEKVKLGKRTCTCTFTMETKGSKCAGQAKCDNKCTGNGAVEVGDYSFTLAVKKGKGKISKCTVAAMPTVGPVEPTGSGSGPAPTGSGTGPMPPTGSGSGMERCTCVGNGGSGPTPPTGSGSGPNPPTGTGSGSGAADGTLYRKELSDYPAAVCNDGSTATYYYSSGVLTSSKLLIYTEGGGACGTKEECQRRCTSPDSSYRCTASTDETLSVNYTFWSNDQDTNPAFHDFGKVWINYCSSDGWSGSRNASSETGGYHFHGKDILKAVVDDIIADAAKTNANINQVVLHGTSAGSAGALYNCDLVASKFKATKEDIDVRCIADSGDFTPEIGQDCNTEEKGEEGLEFYGADLGTCTGTVLECRTFSSYYKILETPLMVVHNYIDPIVKGDCSPSLEPANNDYYIEWRQQVEELSQQFIQDKPQNGIFMLHCYFHVLTKNEKSWSTIPVATVGGTEQHILLKDIIHNWVTGEGPTQAIDSPDTKNINC